MFDERINIKSVHVELTTERQQYVLRHIGPLLRLTDDNSAKMDVIIRSIRRPITGTVCCVMVRFTGVLLVYYLLISFSIMNKFKLSYFESTSVMERLCIT